MEKGSTLDIIKQCFATKLYSSDSRMKVSSLNFITSLVFCFLGDSKVFSLESMRRWMIANLGQTLSKSSFWERLSRKRLKIMLSDLLSSLMKDLVGKVILGKDILSSLGVSKIFILDSSSISLWDGANLKFPGTRTNSAIKWHCCFDLLSAKMSWFKITEGSSNDCKNTPPLNLVKGSLLIFDLGYWNYNFFYPLKMPMPSFCPE